MVSIWLSQLSLNGTYVMFLPKFHIKGKMGPSKCIALIRALKSLQSKKDDGQITNLPSSL